MTRRIRHRSGAANIAALSLCGLLLALGADPVAAQPRIPDRYVKTRLICHITPLGTLSLHRAL